MSSGSIILWKIADKVIFRLPELMLGSRSTSQSINFVLGTLCRPVLIFQKTFPDTIIGVVGSEPHGSFDFWLTASSCDEAVRGAPRSFHINYA